MELLPQFEWLDSKGRTPAELRTLLQARLLSEDREDLAQILEDCGQVMVMQCACCNKTFTIEKGCKKRWCPVCAPRITAARYMRAESVAARFQWPLAVTLTRTNWHSCEDPVMNIVEAFRKFRRTDFWADRVKGGFAGVEITHRGRGYHPHIHALVDCRWLAVSTPAPTRHTSRRAQEQLCRRAQDELAEVWGAYVQGSKASVWVQRAYGQGLAETLKYSIKPSDLLTVACTASSIIDMMGQKRMITSFGHAHACAKNFVGRDLPEERLIECQGCGGFKTILPGDLYDLYQARPEFAYMRFHTLMSLAGDYADKAKQWDPLKTIPPTVPKGFKPSSKRAIVTRPEG